MKTRHPVLVFVYAATVVLQVVSANRGRIFLEGALGVVEKETRSSFAKDSLADSTKRTLSRIVKQLFGTTGNEQFKSAKHSNKLVTDKRGHAHVRFEQTYDGLEVVDAAMVVHMNDRGQVYAINGEYVADGSVDVDVRVSCEDSFNNTLTAHGPEAVWLSDCALKVVFDKFGTPHKAWERMIGYPLPESLYLNDKLYASVVTGELVVTRPQVLGARAIRTEKCKQSTSTANCVLVSLSANPINTSDTAVNFAHNNSILTYNYHLAVHGRDSFDNLGMRVKNRAHVGLAYNNAYWDGYSLNYGDGDGMCAMILFLLPQGS